MKGQADLEGQRSRALGDLSGQEAQMQMASQEAQSARDFQGLEAQKQRDFTKDFQGGQFEKEFGLKRDVFDLEKSSKLRELDMAQNQQDMDRMAQLYNQALSTVQSPYSAERMQNDMMELLKNLDAIKSGKMPVKAAVVKPRTRTVKGIMGGPDMEVPI
jgi:hypothetical protein